MNAASLSVAAISYSVARQFLTVGCFSLSVLAGWTLSGLSVVCLAADENAPLPLPQRTLPRQPLSQKLLSQQPALSSHGN